MKKILFIVNPSSGGNEALEVAQVLEASLLKQKTVIERYETTGTDDFRKLTQVAMQNEWDVVAIFGGDGTISEYVRAIANLKQRPKIILIPLGTTNNLARALGTELNMTALINKISSNQLIEKQVDVGQVNDEYFISTLSAGTIPEVAWKTTDDSKENLGPLAYILQGVTALNNQEAFDLILETDTGSIDLHHTILLVIGLSNSVFGIPVFFDRATVDDGKFHLYALKDADFLKSSTSLATDVFSTYNDNNELSYLTSFKQGKIIASKKMNLAMDGEKGPEFPIQLNNLEKHLQFLVPEAENKKTL